MPTMKKRVTVMNYKYAESALTLKKEMGNEEMAEKHNTVVAREAKKRAEASFGNNQKESRCVQNSSGGP